MINKQLKEYRKLLEKVGNTEEDITDIQGIIIELENKLKELRGGDI